MWLILFFILWPLTEIALFVLIGGQIGVWATVLFVIASAVAGQLVIRAQAGMAAAQIQAAMREMGDPTRPIPARASGMAAGALLMVPGFLTSAIGLLLLIPPVRDLIIRGLRRLFVLGMQRSTSAAFARYEARRGGPVVDGEYSVTPDDPKAPPRVEYHDRDPTRPPSGWSRE